MFFILASAYGLIRSFQAFTGWAWLVSIGLRPGPLYLVVSGSLWGISCLAAGLALFFRYPFAPQFARWTAALCALLYWLEKIFFTRMQESRQNDAFMLAVTLAGLAVVFGLLALPRQRRYFNEQR